MGHIWGCLVWEIMFYWHMAMPLHLHIVYVFVCMRARARMRAPSRKFQLARETALGI